jgi:CheY-like chemotaxis protein
MEASMTTPKGEILIVDDEPGIIRLIGMYLEREGFQTVSARTGTEALSQVAERHASRHRWLGGVPRNPANE